MIASLESAKHKLGLPFSIPSFLNKDYFPSLNGWRAIAIILVILGHLKFYVLTGSNYYKIAEVLIYPRFGVRIFFVLSGFLITSLLIKEFIKKGSINIKFFFLKRVLRIFPVLYLFLLVLALCNYAFELGISLNSFISAAFYFSNFMVLDGSWYTGHTWSLAVEEQFYVLWPFLFQIFKENVVVFCGLILLIQIFFKLFWWFYPQYYQLTLGPFLDNGLAIFYGAALSFLSFKGVFNTSNAIWKNHWLSMLCIFAILSINYSQGSGHFGIVLLPLGDLMLNLLICFLMLQTLIDPSSNLFKILNTRLMSKIGMMSYSIYIWQQLFIVPTMAKDKIPYLLIFPFNIIATMIVAYLSYSYFELYFIRLKKYFV